MDLAVEHLAQLARGRRLVVLTGAGCSTESGIPDYRGIDTPPRSRPPIQHREFVDKPDARRRYWARSMLGWPRLAGARPNAGHRALAALEAAGVVAGLITQNVDGLHGAAGSRDVIELHGAIGRVRCLACDARTTRAALQDRLASANPQWAAEFGLGPAARAIAATDPIGAVAARAASDDAAHARTAPDGDADLSDTLVADFTVVSCEACGGVLMPDVVFFGGSVPRPTLDAAWAAFDRGELLLVVGSSLTVFSGYRFVRRAAERGVPVAIVNRGPTRGDGHAAIRVDARAGEALTQLARALA